MRRDGAVLYHPGNSAAADARHWALPAGISGEGRPLRSPTIALEGLQNKIGDKDVTSANIPPPAYEFPIGLAHGRVISLLALPSPRPGGNFIIGAISVLYYRIGLISAPSP